MISMCICANSVLTLSESSSSVPGILQESRLERVAILSSRALPNPGSKPACLTSPVLGDGLLPPAPPGEPAVRTVSHAAAAAAEPLQSCLTLRDPIDGSPPGSLVHGIFQARVQEWVATAFSDK